MPTPVVDFHIHIMPPDRVYASVLDWMRTFVPEPLEGYLQRASTPAGVLAMMDDAGVDYGVILTELSPITAGLLATNEETAAFCKENPRLVPFANINPHMTRSPARDLQRYVSDFSMRGVKILPTYHHFYPNERSMYPLYAVAQEMGIIAQFHTGSSVFRGSRLKYGDPLFLEDVVLDFPDLLIVMAHSGRGFWMDRAAHLAASYENVYMEIAGLPPQNLLTYFPNLEDLRDKVVFGSDWPSQPFMKRNVEAIKELPISLEAKTKILGGNAARLLDLRNR